MEHSVAERQPKSKTFDTEERRKQRNEKRKAKSKKGIEAKNKSESKIEPRGNAGGQREAKRGRDRKRIQQIVIQSTHS